MNLYNQKINYLVPIYNRENYIEETLDSIVIDIKNFINKKIILLDDGSNDQSLKIIQNYKIRNNLPYIEIHHQDNLGIVAARNKLISLSSNEAWLFLIDSDDRNINGRTIKVLDYMIKNEINICGTFLQCFGESEKIFSYPTDNYTLKKMSGYISVFGNPSVAFSPGIKKLLAYRELPEDFHLFKDLSSSNLKFGNLAKPLVEYRTHNEQITIELSKSKNVCFITKLLPLFFIIFDFKISYFDKFWFMKNYLAFGKIKSYFK